MRIADALWRVLLIIHSEGVELLGLDSYEAPDWYRCPTSLQLPVVGLKTTDYHRLATD